MKPELEKLKEANTKCYNDKGGEFLMFIYETFPPKTNCKPPKKEDVIGKPMKKLKKLFLKAIVHYHPDKVDVERFGEKTKVLNEEITKYLSSFYEVTKEG